VHEELESQLRAVGAALDGAYYCPNHPDGSVERFTRDFSCRKPRLGMLRQAVRDLGIDLSRSAMVGDQASDVDFANRAGIPAVFVTTGKSERQLRLVRERGLSVTVEVPDIAAAVRWFLDGRKGWSADGDSK
jgi:D-glycero-D-manno-heptose 1,7-bisphosphate phosphatase